MSYCCPRCGSYQTQSFSEIHDAGRYSGSSTEVGTAYVAGGSVPYGGVTHHSGMTALAARLAPPRPADMGCAAWTAIIMAFVGALGVTAALELLLWKPPHENPTTAAVDGIFLFVMTAPLLVLGSIVAFLEWRRIRRYNSNEYESAYMQWDRSMHCHRCGYDFIT